MKTNRTFILLMLAGIVGSGCATGTSGGARKFDAKAAERARPYLAGHRAVDLRGMAVVSVCIEPTEKVEAKFNEAWKAWVAAASSCVQKEDWVAVDRLAQQISSRFIDAPWGPYFSGVAASARSENLRAHWMFELAEKKAGGPFGLVSYEKARLLDKEEGPASAVVEMKEAIRLDQSIVAGELWLAQLYHRDRLLDEAEKYYRLAVKNKADLWPALVGLAELEIENKNGAEAHELLARAISLRPNHVETRIRLAMVFESLLKETSKALQTLRELRVAIEKGRATGKVPFDLSAKIKGLEQSMRPEAAGQALGREPAQKKGG